MVPAPSRKRFARLPMVRGSGPLWPWAQTRCDRATFVAPRSNSDALTATCALPIFSALQLFLTAAKVAWWADFGGAARILARLRNRHRCPRGAGNAELTAVSSMFAGPLAS